MAGPAIPCRLCHPRCDSGLGRGKTRGGKSSDSPMPTSLAYFPSSQKTILIPEQTMSNFFTRTRALGACALLVASFLVASLVVVAPALARGAGTYAVKGKEGASGGGYSGASSLTQTGENTWRIVWKIGNQTWNGYGIGDGKIIALNFSGNGQSGVMLLVAKDDNSGYDAAWAYSGDKTVGYEEWRKSSR